MFRRFQLATFVTVWAVSQSQSENVLTQCSERISVSRLIFLLLNESNYLVDFGFIQFFAFLAELSS